MNRDQLEILACPSCKRGLTLVVLNGEQQSKALSAPSDSASDLQILRCECGEIYPIVEGVPRFVDQGLASVQSLLDQHRDQIRKCCGDEVLRKLSSAKPQPDDEYANIRKSFSQEWSIFDYAHDNTWGWSLAERKQVFLDDMQLKAENLRGKRLLDAGCGNGTLSAALTDFGLHVVGLDLNDGLGKAYRNRSKYGAQAKDSVYYVQGNLVEPPFKAGSFDLVYSSGVIHHTPSSKHSFASLAPMVKRGGRMYVWVYRKRAWPVRLFFASGRSLKRVVSLRTLMTICRMMAPVYRLGADILHALKVAPFRKRTSREITLDLFDAFAPRFNHWHTEEEMRSWFAEYGFQNIKVSGVQKHGLGMYGDRA